MVIYACGQLLGLETVQLNGIVLPQGLIDKVPTNVANSYRIIPVRMEDKALIVATSDPDNLAALDDLKFMLGVSQVRPALTSDSSITEALAQYYSMERENQRAAVDKLLQNIGEEEESHIGVGGQETFSIDAEALKNIDTSDAASAAESAPVRKLLNLILLTAVKGMASDIHFEPFEDVFRVRNRIDGVLYEMLPVPKTLAPALVARIKVMSHLDISERRLPQDGKIPVRIGDKEVDLRVSCLPTMFGESVVIRILDRSVVSLDLDKVGFNIGFPGITQNSLFVLKLGQAG